MWTTLIIVIIAATIGIGSLYFTKRDDAPIEEISEAVIEYTLHLPNGSVDLTPNSVEFVYNPEALNFPD